MINDHEQNKSLLPELQELEWLLTDSHFDVSDPKIKYSSMENINSIEQ